MGIFFGRSVRLRTAAARARGGRSCALLLAGALAAATAPAGEGAKPAENAEVARQVEQLADELANPAAVEPDAGAAREIEALIVNFGSNEFQTREAASKAVLGHKAVALGALRRALKDKDQEVAERAGQAIAEIGAQARAAVCAKVKALGDAGRKEVARRLAGATAELAALVAGKKPEDEKAREADEAARRTKAAAIWNRVGAFAEMQGAAWGLADEAPDAGSRSTRLMMVLRDKEIPKRIAAVWALGAIERDQPGMGVGFLGRALNDQDAGVRQALVWALGLSGQAGSPNGQAFIQMLGQNADAEIRKAIEAVKELPRQ